jgi:hypothetical protein
MKKCLMLISVFLLSLPLAMAQGRGGGGGGGGQGGGQGSGGNAQGQGQNQSGRPGGMQTGSESVQRLRARVHATDQQGDQIQSCSKAADKIRKQARDMAKTGARFKGDKARKQLAQVKERVQNMERENARLIQGLDPAQQQAWLNQLRNTERLQEQVRLRIQHMERALNEPNPDANMFGEQAREMEQVMSEWREQYRGMASDIQR